MHSYYSKKKLSEELARYYLHQLIEALEYCKTQDIYHRDIKLMNLLLDENFDLKLVDFGISKMSVTGLEKSSSGTKFAKAPELWEKKLHLLE